MKRNGCRHCDTSGFTLVEVLVAMLVLSITVPALAHGLIMFSDATSTFADHEHMDEIATALFEEAASRRIAADGRHDGVRDGYKWAVSASPIDLSAQMPKPAPVSADTNAPIATVEKIRWGAEKLRIIVGRGSRHIEVEAIHLVRIASVP